MHNILPFVRHSHRKIPNQNYHNVIIIQRHIRVCYLTLLSFVCPISQQFISSIAISVISFSVTHIFVRNERIKIYENCNKLFIVNLKGNNFSFEIPPMSLDLCYSGKSGHGKFCQSIFEENLVKMKFCHFFKIMNFYDNMLSDMIFVKTFAPSDLSNSDIYPKKPVI